MFKGSIVALVTPMRANGDVDFERLEALISWHLSEGTDAFAILGTTGEAATLTPAEYKKVLTTTVRKVASKVPVIAGTGTQSTLSTIEKTKLALECGADASLIVTPFYNKPTQEGLFRHYSEVARAVPLPIILYNVPSRTAVDLLPETVARLKSLPNIVGLKEATGDLTRLEQLLAQVEGVISLYSGDDATAMEFMLRGGSGSISVVANIMPRALHSLCRAAMAKSRDEAMKLNERLKLLYDVLYVESNPIPCKWALLEMGRILEGIRLPLTPLSIGHREALKQALIASGCL